MANKITFINDFRTYTTNLLDDIDKLKGLLQQAEELTYFDDAVISPDDIERSKLLLGGSMPAVSFDDQGNKVSNDPMVKDDLNAAMGTMSAIDDILEAQGHYANLYKVRK